MLGPTMRDFVQLGRSCPTDSGDRRDVPVSRKSERASLQTHHGSICGRAVLLGAILGCGVQASQLARADDASAFVAQRVGNGDFEGRGLADTGAVVGYRHRKAGEFPYTFSEGKFTPLPVNSDLLANGVYVEYRECGGIDPCPVEYHFPGISGPFMLRGVGWITSANRHGVVVGTQGDSMARWSNGRSPALMYSGYGVEFNWRSGNAVANPVINDHGETAVGYRLTEVSESPKSRLTVRSRDGVTHIARDEYPVIQPAAMNNLGQVVGTLGSETVVIGRTSRSYHAFIYEQGVLSDLTPTADKAYATDINDRGDVATIVEGVVVVWTDGRTQATDWTDALSSQSGWSIGLATDALINERGQICVLSWRPQPPFTYPDTFLITPVGELPTIPAEAVDAVRFNTCEHEKGCKAVEYRAGLEGALLQQAVATLELLVARRVGNDPTRRLSINSAWRPEEYQLHLWQIRQQFVALANLPGVRATVKSGTERPVLLIDDGDESVFVSAGARARVDEVNAECESHGLQAGDPQAHYAPRVSNPAKPTRSAATHVKGIAVDLTAGNTGIELPELIRLARKAKLKHTIPKDKPHFELKGRWTGSRSLGVGGAEPPQRTRRFPAGLTDSVQPEYDRR